MANIQFEEEQNFVRPNASDVSHGLTALVQKWGLAKDESGAQKILLITLALCVLATFVLLYSFGGGPPHSVPPPSPMP